MFPFMIRCEGGLCVWPDSRPGESSLVGFVFVYHLVREWGANVLLS